MDKPTCSVQGCGKPSHSRGWCPMHYQRWRKHGSLDKPPPRERPDPKPCSVEGCASSADAKGMCRKHYARAWHERNWERTYAKQVARRQSDRDAYLAQSRAYYAKNKARILKRMSEAYAEDPQPKRDASRIWARRNAVRRREYEMRRRAQMRATQTEPVDYDAIMAAHGMFCHICSLIIVDESDLHFDHVIPLSKGGTHTSNNIKPAHALCNMRKHASVG